jgi:flagellar basal-body rod protein FlgB
MFNLVDQDRTMGVLEKVMDLASARHSLIASNIANLDTPGYKAVDMEFKRELRIALDQARSTDVAPGSSGTFRYETVLSPRIFEVQGVAARQDGNTVDMDRELGKLANVSSLYNRAATIYGLKLKMLKNALRGD